MASSSSSTATTTTGKVQITEPIPKGRKTSKILRRSNYTQRKKCIAKKTKELSLLCGIDVCTIVIGADGEVDTWPNRTDADRIIKRFKEFTFDGLRKRKRVQHGDDFNQVNVKEQRREGRKFEGILENLDKFTDSQRREMLKQVDSKLEALAKRLESYEERHMKLFGQDIVTYIEKERSDDRPKPC